AAASRREPIMSRTRVFVSYSTKDSDWLARLRVHLGFLERQKLIDVWWDTRIEVGADWEQEIEKALGSAQVAVLMISPAFLASDYVWQKEMPRILAHAKEGMEIVPLIIRPCAWKLEAALARFQARPPGGLALSGGTPHQIDRQLARITYE